MSTPQQPDAGDRLEQSASAPRPAPHYGEYATPEQQRAAIREPAQPQASAGVPSAPAPQPFPQAQSAPQPHPRTVTHATTRAARPSRRADRIVTFALLAYGLVTVVSAVPQLWHFAAFAQTWMGLAGIDETFTNTAQGDLWGRIGAGVFVVGWLLTAWLSWRALSRGRLSWWIPLVGAIAAFIVVTVCLTVPLLGDPAIAAHFGA